MNRSTVVIVLIIAATSFLWWHARQNSPKELSRQILRVGTNAEYPPFSFVEDDTIVGFDIDVIYEVARRLGKKIDLQDMPFDALLPKLQLGYIQVIAAGITATQEREKNVLFTKPYLTRDPLLIITLKGGEPIVSVHDLPGKTVVVNEGYTADAYVSGMEGVDVKRLATPAEAFLLLKTGRVAAYVAAQSSVQSYFKQYNKDEFVITPIKKVYDSYSFAVSRAHSEYLPEIQRVLDAMEKDGTLARLKEKWEVQ